MDLTPQTHDKIRRLIEKGVVIPAPQTIDIGSDVNVEHISGDDVHIYPGCRISGERTVIQAGCRIGQEGPVIIDNCQLGQSVELKGGFFRGSVFLDRVTLGAGAQVREGCLLEEESGGAHTVGLKQTILFPFVTLGSLINFCDCLMAGGTSRRDHSEVGSSFIHFNFTPDADKTTPSLLGDVARGVMLCEPPIFLGGQGGIVGPVRLGFGSVVVAGSILRNDYPLGRQIISEPPCGPKVADHIPRAYPRLWRIVTNNIHYLANLKALVAWYTDVRGIFFQKQPLGSLVHASALDVLEAALRERLARLKAMSDKAVQGPAPPDPQTAAQLTTLHARFSDLEAVFTGTTAHPDTQIRRDAFLDAFARSNADEASAYLEAVRSFPADLRSAGIAWLQDLTTRYIHEASALLSYAKPVEP